VVSADQLARQSQETLRQQESAPYVDVELALYGIGIPSMQHSAGFDSEVEDHWRYYEQAMKQQQTEAAQPVSGGIRAIIHGRRCP